MIEYLEILLKIKLLQELRIYSIHTRIRLIPTVELTWRQHSRYGSTFQIKIMKHFKNKVSFFSQAQYGTYGAELVAYFGTGNL